jgi:hypothetical protein
MLERRRMRDVGRGVGCAKIFAQTAAGVPENVRKCPIAAERLSDMYRQGRDLGGGGSIGSGTRERECNSLYAARGFAG